MISRFTLSIFVFVAGAAVMILEITGSRLLVPYTGTSTYAWTSLIGVILASLSAGYWIGGRMADRHQDPRLLALLAFGAGAFIIAVPAGKALWGNALFAIPDIRLRATIGGMIAFAIPGILLGMVFPYAARLAIAAVATAGNTVGKLSAFSTIGSICGTFAAGFLLIPRYNISTILVATGCVLWGSAAVLLSTRLAKISALALTIAAGAALLYLKNPLPIEVAASVNSAYSRIWVIDGLDQATRRPVRDLITNPDSIQSRIYTDDTDERQAADYGKLVAVIERGHAARDAKQDALFLGGGGFTLPADYLRLFPAGQATVVEIDPAIVAIARQFFGLRDDPRLAVIVEDGRLFVEQEHDRRYGTIVLDIFQSCAPPEHLVTREALARGAQLLDDSGIFMMNVVARISTDPNAFLPRLLATFRSTFPETAAFRVAPSAAATDLQNLIIVASKEPLASLVDDETARELDARAVTTSFPIDARELTDDYAPVESLIACPVIDPIGTVLSRTE